MDRVDRVDRVDRMDRMDRMDRIVSLCRMFRDRDSCILSFHTLFFCPKLLSVVRAIQWPSSLI
jgi:hypothetical protein